MKVVGYVRGTNRDSIDRQIKLLEDKGITILYIEEQIGNTQTIVLNAMLEEINDGDIVVIESIQRLNRSTKGLLSTIEKLEKKGISLISINDDFDSRTPVGKQFMEILKKASEKERELLKESQIKGIERAKKNKKYRGRKKIEIDNNLFEAVYKLWKIDKEISARKAMTILELKPNTFYRRVREYEDNQMTDFK